MPINILMPALSPTMTEGNLAKWHKKTGDSIAAGEVIAEIETDKATMEVEAVDEGILGKILIEEGAQAVKVNEIIAVLLEEGEDASALEKAVTTSNDNSGATTAQATEANAPKSATPAATASPSATPAPTTGGKRLFITPLARRIAAQNKLDAAKIKGTGPHGRILKADVEAALQAKPTAATSAAASPQTSTDALAIDQFGMPPATVQPHTTMRKVIARRLTESKQQVPHFYLTVDIELDALLALRKQINAREKQAVKLSVNDFIIKACAVALKEVPAANASWSDEGVRLFSRADVSVAVAIEGGLITPIVRGACLKNLTQISTEMKDLAVRARANKLKPEEFQGGTFSLSNLGMFGIKNFSAIVNPPQGCILAVGGGEERAVVKNGQLTIATVMSCTLSVDHRVVDGAVGAEFLKVFKEALQDPLTLVL